jgi:hypothetical protein
LISLGSLITYGDGNTTSSSANSAGNNPSMLNIIQVTIPSVIVAAGSQMIIRDWHRKKEETKIRRDVMEDFQTSFKDYVVLVDTFVAKIVVGCHIFEKKENKNQIELSQLLPYGFKDLEGDMDDIRHVQAYFEFPENEMEQPSRKFASDFEKFEKEFFDKRMSVTKFLSGLRLYYKNGEQLNDQFDKMWLRIMVNHTLILKMMKSNNQEEFVSLVKKYNESAAILFENMRAYDKILGVEKISIGKKS